MEKNLQNKSRVLITGAEGFTGNYLTKVLSSAGHDVIGTSLKKKNNSSNIFYLDLKNQHSVIKLVNEIKPDVVAHLGAISFVGEDNVSNIYETNLLGTLHLLNALTNLKKHQPRSILLASSATIYGNNSLAILNEDVYPNPINDYAVSKYAMEKMAKLWMNRLPLFIVRPFNYTGVGQPNHFLIPKIVEHFKKKESSIKLGNIDVWREVNDVRFVVETYKKLIDLNPSGQIINICTGHIHSLKEIIQCCEKITNYHIEIQIDPQLVRNNEIQSLRGDNTVLKKLIGNIHSPSIYETLTWMLSHGDEK